MNTASTEAGMSVNCPQCGGALKPYEEKCAYCGAVIEIPEKEAELRDLARALNQRLEVEHDRQSRFFGCAVFLGMPMVCLAAALLAATLTSLHWGWILGIGLAVSAIYFGAGLMLSEISEKRALRRIYQQVIAPQIAAYLRDRDMPRWRFNSLVNAALPEDARLHEYLFDESA